jgi:outer membrane protein
MLVGTSALAAGTAYAQATAPRPAAPTPAAAPAPPAAAATATLATATGDPGAPQPVPTDLLEVHAGGITAEQAGARAAATDWNAKASMAALRGAAARVDEAWAAYLPRLSGTAKYTRLSNFTPPEIPFFPPGIDLVTSQAAGALPAGAPLTGVSLPAFTFPLVLDNTLLQASLTVPISDYFLKIDQNYTAATQSQEASRWDLAGVRATALSNGEIAYYAWLSARAAIVVQVQTLNDQKTHLRDSNNQFAVGNASKADVLRAETSVWTAELAVEHAKNMADLTEKQLRVAMHAPDTEAILPGEDLETPLQPVPTGVPQLIAEALGARAEIKSADANAESIRKQAQAARAGRYPVLTAFGDAIEGNPNPRVFPQYPQKWFPTWDVGAQLTWSPNDILTANGSVADIESRVAATMANKNVVRDGIQVEVTQDFQAVEEADFALQSTARELASAQEAYRVATELFNNGRGTYTTVSDSQTQLTQARLDVLNAKTQARVARIHLDHALGRDLSRASASAAPQAAPAPQGTGGPQQTGSAADVLRY